jgi:hypothetical protein
MENNLFTYATGELSQDAFLFYLFNFATSDGKEGNLARSFLKEFDCPEIDNNNYKNFEIFSYKQCNKIDVLLAFENKASKDKSFLLVLEDKINAEESKKHQLTSYLEALKRNGLYETDVYHRPFVLEHQNLKPVYFKTGFVSSYEVETATEQKIKLITREIIWKLIKNYDGTDIIIKQWIEYILKEEKKLQEMQTLVKNDSSTTMELFTTRAEERRYNSLDVLNQWNWYIFGKDNPNEIWEEYGRGHCFLMNILPKFTKKFTEPNYNRKNPDANLEFRVNIRICDLGTFFVFQTYVQEGEDDEYCPRDFYDDYPEVDKKFTEEKAKIYDKLKEKVNLTKLKGGNVKLAEIDWFKEIKNLTLKEYKDKMLEWTKILEGVCKELGYV